jgi:hypothetical protein
LETKKATSMNKSFFAVALVAATLATPFSGNGFAATTIPPVDPATPADVAAAAAKKPLKKVAVTCAKTFTLVKGKCIPATENTKAAPSASATTPADATLAKPADAKKVMKKIVAKVPEAAAPDDATAPMDATAAKSADAKKLTKKKTAAAAPVDATKAKPVDAKKMTKKKVVAKIADTPAVATPEVKQPQVVVTCAEGYTLVKNKCVEATAPSKPQAPAMAAKKTAKPVVPTKKTAVTMVKPADVTKAAMAKPADKVKEKMAKKPDAMKKTAAKKPAMVTCAKGLVLQKGKCIAAEAAVQ